MKNRSVFLNLQYLITRDQKFLFTLLSYIATLVVFVNISLSNSLVIGILASATYFLINATYLGHALFKKENAFIAFMMGTLLLIVILGLVAWAVMISYNLDNIRSVIVLFITASLASILNRKVKSENASP